MQNRLTLFIISIILPIILILVGCSSAEVTPSATITQSEISSINTGLRASPGDNTLWLDDHTVLYISGFSLWKATINDDTTWQSEKTFDGSSIESLLSSKYLDVDDNFATAIMNRPVDKFTADRVPVQISLETGEAVDAEYFPFIFVVHSSTAHVFTQDGWIPATEEQIESVGVETLLAMELINGTAVVPAIPKESSDGKMIAWLHAEVDAAGVTASSIRIYDKLSGEVTELHPDGHQILASLAWLPDSKHVSYSAIPMGGGYGDRTIWITEIP